MTMQTSNRNIAIIAIFALFKVSLTRYAYTKVFVHFIASPFGNPISSGQFQCSGYSLRGCACAAAEYFNGRKQSFLELLFGQYLQQP